MIEQTADKTVAEFFAGIGLMRAGLDRAGWTTAVANDIDPVKRKLYLNHFKDAGDPLAPHLPKFRSQESLSILVSVGNVSKHQLK